MSTNCLNFVYIGKCKRLKSVTSVTCNVSHVCNVSHIVYYMYMYCKQLLFNTTNQLNEAKDKFPLATIEGSIAGSTYYPQYFTTSCLLFLCYVHVTLNSRNIKANIQQHPYLQVRNKMKQRQIIKK